MQTALVCLCLCLLSTAFSTPVPPPLPGRAVGNCVGQHRILLKGCNAKHGFYVFKYVYSFSTRRNQTQIKKEDADSQSTVSGRRLGDDNAKQLLEDRVAPAQGDNSSTDAMENGTGLKPENRSAPGVGGDARSPQPGTGTRAHGGVGVVGPTLASSEGSGDLDLIVEVDGGVSILPQGRRPSEAMAGNRSSVRSEDRDDGAPGGVPVEGAMTAGRERATATGGAEDEGSGEATVPSQGQEGIMQGTGTGGATLAASITEKLEDIQVDAEGVDEYAYIPDSSSVIVTHGKVDGTERATSFTQVSPDKNDEVSIFIGRTNIHVGEQETTQASATVGSKDDGIPPVGTSSPLPRLGVTVAHDGNNDDGNPARRQPEGLSTTATPIHGDNVTSSPGDGHPIEDNEGGATAVGDGEEPVAPRPWTITDGDTTVPTGAGIRRKGDDEVRGEGQRFEGRPDHLAVTAPRQEDAEEATSTVAAKGASIRLDTTVASPGVSEGDCTTTLGITGSRKAGTSAVAGRGGSREVGPATSQPHREGRPGAGVRVWLGGAGLNNTPRTEKVPSPHGKASSWASSKAQTRVSGHDDNAKGRPLAPEAQARAGSHGTHAEGRPRAPEAGVSPPLQAGQARGSVAVGKGQERERGGEAAVAAAGARGGRLHGHHGRRPGARAPGAFAALGRSRQVDQVKRADELHVRERAFYTLGGAGGGPRSPYASLGSADSSQSSEGEHSSRSDSRQSGLRPSERGAAGHPHGHWSQAAL